MSSISRKIAKNAEQHMINELYNNMTPAQYKEGIQTAIKKTEERLLAEYQADLKNVTNQYNKAIQENTLIAMDTLAVEMLYELGNMLECYVENPEFLDQKIDIVQKLYDTAMSSIEGYGDKTKYKTDEEAQRVFEEKRDTIKNVFGVYK